jgi:hypothetical protein
MLELLLELELDWLQDAGLTLAASARSDEERPMAPSGPMDRHQLRR